MHYVLQRKSLYYVLIYHSYHFSYSYYPIEAFKYQRSKHSHFMFRLHELSHLHYIYFVTYSQSITLHKIIYEKHLSSYLDPVLSNTLLCSISATTIICVIIVGVWIEMNTSGMCQYSWCHSLLSRERKRHVYGVILLFSFSFPHLYRWW